MSKQQIDIYIGSDRKIPEVTDVCAFAIKRHARVPVRIRKLDLGKLIEAGLYGRAVDPLASTEFTYSRFLTPFLNGYKGLCVFCDNDFLFTADIGELVQGIDPAVAVSCVHQNHRPNERIKLDGRIQTVYTRKNWSSLMVFDAANPYIKTLSVEAVNTRSGAYLHQFAWVPDSAIGKIGPEWNWLEGHSLKPSKGVPKAIHFTRGGPWHEAWEKTDYAGLWLEERDRWELAGRPAASATIGSDYSPGTANALGT